MPLVLGLTVGLGLGLSSLKDRNMFLFDCCLMLGGVTVTLLSGCVKF